jgi:imidazole glycerol-phosphate synthase subunit HisF
MGTQSVVAVMDVKKHPATSADEIFTHNGQRPTGKSPVEFAQLMQKHGAGEVVVNSIDNDGLMNGYDIPLIERVRATVTVPVTVLGGAGSLKDIGQLIAKFGIIGAAAGSLFVFKGPYRAVLINYPSRVEKEKLAALPA